jgi:hypothetical protein
MTNTLLTVSMITKRAVTMFRNSNAFLQLIDRQYDSEYRNRDFKIGSTLNIRLPVDYVVGTGATVTPQSTVETQTQLVVGTQANVAASFTSVDFALKIDDFADRFLAKMVNDLAAYVAQDVMSAVNGTPNIVANFDGSNNVLSPTMDTFLSAGAVLDNLSALRDEPRKAILSPQTMARTVSSFAGLFNPASSISENYKVGAISGGIALGIQDWRIDQTVINHTTGTCTGATVNGASQTGSTITLNAVSGTLKVGDIITFAGVHAVNRLTKQSTGQLAQFVVTQNVSNTGTSVHIYPALTPVGAGPVNVQYQTVDVSPADGAAVTPAIPGGGITYRENLVFRKEAFTLVVADLPLIRNGVVKSARESYDGVSLRMVEGYDVINDIFVDRMDILYGYCQPRPEWCVIVADAL